jgi:hypothetical protein
MKNNLPTLQTMPSKIEKRRNLVKRPGGSAFDSALEAAELIFNNLTFKVFASIIVLGIGLAIAAFLYDNRSWIFNSAISEVRAEHRQTWVIGDESKRQINNFFNLSSDVALVSVTSVNLKQNRRRPEFFIFRDPIKQQIATERASKILLSQPVFDYNHTNTRHMVRIIGNEFTCIPFKDAYYSKFVIEFEKDIPTMCFLSIPPYPGQFFGYIGVGLKRPLSYNELEAIRIEMSRLSVDIFLRDIAKKTEKDF